MLVFQATALLNVSRLTCSGPLSGPLCKPNAGMGLHKGRGMGEGVGALMVLVGPSAASTARAWACTKVGAWVRG